MNKFERQSRHPAEPQTLPEAIAGDLSHLPPEVIDISDAPPIAPRAPLTQGQVRTILKSLMLTMSLAARDQTIVATAPPNIGGPVLGGVFAEHLHWSMIFWINVPLGLGSLALLLPRMGKIPVFHRRRKVDWLGGLLLMASAVVFMLVLTWGGNRYLWLSPTIMAMVGASIALALAFVWHARKAEEPFLPLPLMGGTVVPYAMAAGGCALGAMLGLTVHLPLYYEVVYHLSASEAGLSLIPLAAVSTGGAAIAGRTMARARHYKRVAIIGNVCAALAGIALALTMLPLWAL